MSLAPVAAAQDPGEDPEQQGGERPPACEPYYIVGRPSLSTYPILGMVYINEKCIRDGIDRWLPGSSAMGDDDP